MRKLVPLVYKEGRGTKVRVENACSWTWGEIEHPR